MSNLTARSQVEAIEAVARAVTHAQERNFDGILRDLGVKRYSQDSQPRLVAMALVGTIVGLLRRCAVHEGLTVDEVWQDLALRYAKAAAEVES